MKPFAFRVAGVFTAFALFLLTTVLTAQEKIDASTANEPKIIAAGEWSRPVADTRGYALRGRLVLCEKRASDDLRDVAVYVELQDASEFIGNAQRIFCEMDKRNMGPEYKGGLQCELHDKDKRLVPSSGFAFGGGVPRSDWVTLPSDATIRVRATPFGIRRPRAVAIVPYLNTMWVIENKDPNPYFLSGTFTVAPIEERNMPSAEHIWRGTLVLPAARIVSKRPE